MTNFYDILGVKQSASAGEIKTAFRALAKIWHPDKNPSGLEHFKNIVKAYETLINPTRKSAYDLKLKYHQNVSTTHTTGNKTKNWTFDEKEMKRRQYYNDHIKKYEKVNKAKAQHAELKKNYNEYKYILYATPIAVALFLLVINFATPSHKTDLNSPEVSKSLVKKSPTSGDFPYSEYFGKEQFIENGQTLIINNQIGYSVVICIFVKGEFARCFFMDAHNSAKIPQLPSEYITIRYSTGKMWDYDKTFNDRKVRGGFTTDAQFFESRHRLRLEGINQITLTKDKNYDFKPVSENEFFRKEEVGTPEKK